MGLLVTGVVVYAKENPSNFLVTSPSSLEEKNQAPQTASTKFLTRIEETLGLGGNEEVKLAEPQALSKKQMIENAEPNFLEATVSKISESGNEAREKAAAVAACIEEAGKSNQ